MTFWMRLFLGTATVPVLQTLFLKPQSDAVSMLDTIYQEGLGIELVPFIVALYSERYTGKNRSEAVQKRDATKKILYGARFTGRISDEAVLK